MAYTVQKGDILSKLYGANWRQLSGYAGDPTKLQIGTQLNDLPGQAIPAANMAPATPFKPAIPQIDPSVYSTTGISDGLMNQANIAQANVDALNKQGLEATNSKALLESLLGNKIADTNQTYNEKGVTDLYNKLKDYSTQSIALQGEAQLIPSIVQEQNANTGSTDAGIAPSVAGALRKNAIKQFSLAQSAAIVSNDYDKAKGYADQIIDAKYAQIEADIKAKQTNLEGLKNFQLTPAQEKLKVAEQNLLAQQKAEIDQKKADDAKMNDTLFKAMQGGAPPELTSLVQDAINKGTATVGQVNQMLAEYTLNLPASAQEYQFAVRNGYTGSFTQYQNEDANRKVSIAKAGVGGSGGSSGGGGTTGLSPLAKAVIDGVVRLEDLTPTQRGNIAPELAKAGYKSGPKLTAGQQDDIAQLKTVNGLLDEILAFNSDGKLEGIGSFGLGSLKAIGSQLGFSSEEAKTVRTLIGNVKGTIAKLRGGTSFTTNEEKLLNSYTPDINDAPSVAINKINNLKSYINQKNANLLGAAQERGVPANIDNLRNKYNY